MKKSDKDGKLLAVAVFAVLIEELVGDSLQPSTHSEGGFAWSRDHRRMALGRRNLFRARSRRSTIR